MSWQPCHVLSFPHSCREGACRSMVACHRPSWDMLSWVCPKIEYPYIPHNGNFNGENGTQFLDKAKNYNTLLTNDPRAVFTLGLSHLNSYASAWCRPPAIVLWATFGMVGCLQGSSELGGTAQIGWSDPWEPAMNLVAVLKLTAHELWVLGGICFVSETVAGDGSLQKTWSRQGCNLEKSWIQPQTGWFIPGDIKLVKESVWTQAHTQLSTQYPASHSSWSTPKNGCTNMHKPRNFGWTPSKTGDT